MGAMWPFTVKAAVFQYAFQQIVDIFCQYTPLDKWVVFSFLILLHRETIPKIRRGSLESFVNTDHIFHVKIIRGKKDQRLTGRTIPGQGPE